MPMKGLIKVNVHGFLTDQPFENGNHSGIRVVYRNIKGDILTMLGGSLCIEDRRINELNAFMGGMKETFYHEYTNIILETNHFDAYWEMMHSTVEGPPSFTGSYFIATKSEKTRQEFPFRN
ncbi:hypothetical protein POM88_041925 [Heracleum sosnowskyi]|uniref:Uncharacterized protein n=1 Tax=Heracleum sosnowskyi TaxID=360622 RepID=A0AAD8MB77_9APIA|nr:hypothetical protein POM88_041925 [Heracleum sosnowskyi]